MVVLFIAVSYPFLGFDAWITFFDQVAEVANKPSSAVTAYQSIPSFFKHLFTYDTHWNPYPVFVSTFMGEYFLKALIFSLILGSLILGYFSKNIDLKVSLAAVVSVITSPLALDYHYALLLLPSIAVLANFQGGNSKKASYLIVAGILLISLPFPYTSEILGKGIIAVFAYPKLYGGLILLILIFIAIRREIISRKIIQLK